MAALGLTVANDIVNLALIWYVRGKALTQTTQDKPLLDWLRRGQKSWPGGNSLQFQQTVQGTYMSDTPGFIQGFSNDDSLNINTASNTNKYLYTGKEMASMLVITWTELLNDGISIIDDARGGRKSEHSEVAMTRITGILENRMDDFGESWSRGTNDILWKDGSADPKLPPGIFSILTDNPTSGVTGSLNRATYPWWRHRVNLGLVASPANSALIQFFNAEILQLKRFGGKPNKALCGSDFLTALRSELFAKGYFTQEGFQNEHATDLGMGGLHITGIGKFEYDPTLDNYGMSKRCYIMDGRRLAWKYVEGEDNKVLNPERPYQYLVFLHGLKTVGVMIGSQLTCHGVYAVA